MDREKIETPYKIDQLINALSSGDQETIGVTTNALAEIGQEVVPFLINALHNDNFKVRYKIIEILEHFQGELLLQPLIELLKDKNAWVSWRAARLLLIMGHKEGYLHLDKELREGPKIGKILAAQTIGELNLIEATEVLLVTLSRSRDTQLRKNIVCALGEIADAKAIASILTLARCKDSSVRWWVVHSVHLISIRTSDKQAVVSLIAMLKDADPDVRYEVAVTLGDLGDPQALNALEHIYKHDKGRKEKGGQMEVRDAALEAINKIKNAMLQVY